MTALPLPADVQRTKFAGAMTNFTSPPKITPVHIILVVTTDAGTRHDKFVRHFLLVARVAIRLFVPAIKLEFGALVVIEIPRFP